MAPGLIYVIKFFFLFYHQVLKLPHATSNLVIKLNLLISGLIIFIKKPCSVALSLINVIKVLTKI